MTISQLFSLISSKRLISIPIFLFITACSTEENIGSSGLAQGVILSWVAPVAREDETPISMAEIGGYRVYYGTTQGNYTNQVDIADSSTMQVTLSSLAAGTYYIVVTTYDMDGRESAFSQVITKSV